MKRKTRRQLKQEIRQLKIKLKRLTSFDIQNLAQDSVMKRNDMDIKENTENTNNGITAFKERLIGVNDIQMQE